MTKAVSPTGFHTAASFHKVEVALRKCTRLRGKQDEAWFAEILTMVSVELDEILTVHHEAMRRVSNLARVKQDHIPIVDETLEVALAKDAHFAALFENDSDRIRDTYFEVYATKAAKRAREGSKGGRPSRRGDIRKTTLIALADLFHRVTGSRAEFWNLPASQRSHFATFVEAALEPIVDQDRSDASLEVWRRARKKMNPDKGLPPGGLPSKRATRIGKTPLNSGVSGHAEKQRTRRSTQPPNTRQPPRRNS